MNTASGPAQGRRLARSLAWLVLLWLLPWSTSNARPTDLHGRWFETPAGWVYGGQATLDGSGLRETKGVSPTGGQFWYQADFSVAAAGVYVLDFKNSSVLGRFRHHVYDAQGALVAEAGGGIQDATPNPFFLRHARELRLGPGRYRLVSRLDSPFFLAQPEPYLDTVANYRQAIKPGNALVLLCLGVFIGLGLYYASLALVRRRTADAMYALFILGNLLYNGSALLVFSELLDSQWFYLVSAPILFSNIAYILFVVALLEIRRDTAPALYRTSRVLIGAMAAFIAIAVLRPSWSMELDRIGVAMFLLFGLSAGVLRALRGHALARLYLVANVAFFVPAAWAISLLDIQGVYTLYIEHLGLVAVTIEVVLLALVLSYQFALLHRDKEHALAQAENSLRIARTDDLTGLPNRQALEAELAALPPQGSLTFIDLDGLKYYNDTFGHARGDALLRAFATLLSNRLGGAATLHRLGGDEFAVTSPSGDAEFVERMLGETVEALRQANYEFSGASFGTVWVHENDAREQLKHIADTRMYEHKRRRRVRDPSSIAFEESGLTRPPTHRGELQCNE